MKYNKLRLGAACFIWEKIFSRMEIQGNWFRSQFALRCFHCVADLSM